VAADTRALGGEEDGVEVWRMEWLVRRVEWWLRMLGEVEV